jgi:hypothetical protein
MIIFLLSPITLRNYIIMPVQSIVTAQRVKNALLPVTVDDAIVNDAVTEGNGIIFSITGRDDWDANDPIYEEIENIGVTYALYNIYNGLDENMFGKKADRAYNAYKDLVDNFRTKNTSNKGNPFFLVQMNPDLNPYTNPDIPPYLDHY